MSETDVRKANSLWKILAAVILAVAGTIGGGLAGKSAGQTSEPERLRAVEVRQDAIDARLLRIEDKIDRILEKK